MDEPETAASGTDRETAFLAEIGMAALYVCFTCGPFVLIWMFR